MKKMIFSIFLLLSIASQAANYELDPVHSVVGFSVKHLVVSKVKGRFNKFEGTFVFDDKKAELSKIDVKIDPASIDTNNKKRDEHLMSPDFFDVKKNAEMKFKSEKPVVVKVGQAVKVTGDLTMRGVTKPVSLDLTYGGSIVDPMGKEKVGFTLTGTLNRKDWGVAWNKNLDKGGVAVSDEVALEIEGEAQKNK